MVTIRIMSWNLENYGLTKFQKYDLGPIIAKIMKCYQIDIAALIEIAKNGHPQIRNNIVVNLDNLGYHTGKWKHAFVDVDNKEGVAFVWHEENAGANAFYGYEYTNHPGAVVAGTVIKDDKGEQIYFPKTQTTWKSLPGKPMGRRPGYCTFVTNDGTTRRIFTVLDIHTPFNGSSFIQAYSTTLYGRSQEIQRIENFDVAIDAAKSSKSQAKEWLQTCIEPSFKALKMQCGAFADAVSDATFEAIKQSLQADKLLEKAFIEGKDKGIDTACKCLPNLDKIGDREELARTVALAGSGASIYMIASIAQSVSPNWGRVDDAIKCINKKISEGRKRKGSLSKSIKDCACDFSDDVNDLFKFPFLPKISVNSAIVAGDFNIDSPDRTSYLESQKKMLLSLCNKNKPLSDGAYTCLSQIATHAGINEKTTSIGPTAFESQRIYRLKQPVPIQHSQPTKPCYVPLDVTSLNGKNIFGNNEWQRTLQNLAQSQKINWSALVQNSVQTNLLENAFETKVINNTSYYRANTYDHIFVYSKDVPSTTIICSGVIDIYSELGSWSCDNYWPAANKYLNHIAEQFLNDKYPSQQDIEFCFGKSVYKISPTLQDAEDAAVFCTKFISDHLPVFVEVVV